MNSMHFYPHLEIPVKKIFFKCKIQPTFFQMFYSIEQKIENINFFQIKSALKNSKWRNQPLDKWLDGTSSSPISL